MPSQFASALTVCLSPAGGFFKTLNSAIGQSCQIFFLESYQISPKINIHALTNLALLLPQTYYFLNLNYLNKANERIFHSK